MVELRYVTVSLPLFSSTIMTDVVLSQRNMFTVFLVPSQWMIWIAINSSLRGLDRLKGAKIVFKYGEERSIVCDCTYEEKTIFLGFTQNGCYGNQPHPFESLI